MSTLKDILIKKDKSCKSVWFMRQAGRYLPEFKKIRIQNQNFIELCLNSKLSSEITLQPIKRFDLDSAIIFSDILLTPYALGQKVEFTKNLGPKIDNFNLEKFFDVSESEFSQKLDSVYKAIEITKNNLSRGKSLIGFIGAPWTLLVYMLNIKVDKKKIDLNKLKEFEGKIEKILNKLIKFLCLHIENQVNAGADVIQIFDSWAGLIPNKSIKDYCYEPNVKIVDFCKKNKIPNICFPKGIKEGFKDFNNIVKPDGINIDYEINPEWVKKNLKDVVIQGGLNPKSLLGNKEEMIKGATKYIQTFKDIPYIFNLGHGLLPETDPDRVKKLIEFYRNYQ
tara:strand:- start:5148 stop:6158 length:1011 start_codon:yes stop_codon:yes gene_type:complete